MAIQQSRVVDCPRCGQANRVIAGRANPRCGSCHAALPAPSSKPIPVTDGTFQGLVLESDLPVLVDCWAPWCGPCRMLAPTLDALAARLAGQLTVAKLDTEQNPRMSGQLQIQGIPTLLIYHRGKQIARRTGVMSGPQLESWLKEAGVI